MRIWQRRATAWIGVGPASAPAGSETRSLKTRIGSAANRSGSALSTRKFSSGMGPFLQAQEEAADLVPCGLTAREASPGKADEAHQLVTLVDAHAVAFARLAHPVDQQRLDVRLERPEDRVELGQ